MFDGVDETLDRLRPLALGGEFQCVGNGMAGEEEQLGGGLDCRADLAVEAAATQTNDIESSQLVLTVGHVIRRNVLADRGISLGDGEVADVNELMEARAAAEEDTVAEMDVTSEQNVVGEDVVISHVDVVGEVRTGHQEIAFAQGGEATVLGTAVDGDVFPQGVLRTNADAGLRGGIKRQILRVRANDRTPADLTAFPDLDISRDPGMPPDAYACSQNHRPLDHGKRTYRHVLGERGVG